MRSFHLNVWQRTGIMLAVVWAVASGLYMYSRDAERAGAASFSAHQACVSAERKRLHADAFMPRDSFAKCGKEAQEAYDAEMRGNWVGIILVALAPIPISWLIAYGFVAARRRIRVATTTGENNG